MQRIPGMLVCGENSNGSTQNSGAHASAPGGARFMTTGNKSYGQEDTATGTAIPLRRKRISPFRSSPTAERPETSGSVRKHRLKLLLVQRPVAIRVQLIEHLLRATEPTMLRHESAELLSINRAITVHVSREEDVRQAHTVDGRSLPHGGAVAATHSSLVCLQVLLVRAEEPAHRLLRHRVADLLGRFGPRWSDVDDSAHVQKRRLWTKRCTTRTVLRTTRATRLLYVFCDFETPRQDWNSVNCTGKKTPGGSVPVPELTSAAARALRKYDDECL